MGRSIRSGPRIGFFSAGQRLARPEAGWARVPDGTACRRFAKVLRRHLGARAEDLPCAAAEWQRIVSLPLFPGMTTNDVDRVADTLGDIVRRHRR